MKHLKTGDLVRLTGYSRASIARMARGFQIPGTCTPDGVHFAFEDGDGLRRWVEERKKRRTKFSAGRPTSRAASYMSRALSGGGEFYINGIRLAKLGKTDEARELIEKMNKSIESIRQACDGESD